MIKLFSLNLCVLFILPFILLMSSCEEPQPKSPVTDFSAELKVKYNNMDICGEFSNTRQGVMTFSATSPETIKGIKYSYKSGELSMSLDGLECIVSPEYLPESNFVNCIYECMTLLKDENNYTYKTRENDNAIFNAKAGKEYTVYTQKDTGVISKIETELIVAEFSNQKSFQD